MTTATTTDEMIEQGRRAIVECGLAREQEESALAKRNAAMRALYADGQGMSPPAIGRALGLSATLVRGVVCPPKH